jgi:hypothetical protein
MYNVLDIKVLSLVSFALYVYVPLSVTTAN